MDSDDLLYDGLKTITHCLLPQLAVKCDENYINEQTFESFRERLDYHLPYIFEMVKHRDDELFCNVGDTKEIRVNFILLLCEQTSSCDMFTSRKYKNQMQNLVDSHFYSILENDADIPRSVMMWYKEIVKNKWKYNMGAVFGYIRFCELYFTKVPIPSDYEIFLLSAGLELIVSTDQVYKVIGIKLLKILLDHSHDKKELVAKNIHMVVFDSVFNHVPKIMGGMVVWECIYSCMEMGYTAKEYYKWNQLDDVFDLLTNRFVFTKTVCETTDMMMMLAKFACIPFRKHSNVLKMMDPKALKADYSVEINELREAVSSFENHVMHRWVKRVCQVLIAQSTFIFGRRTDEIILLINAMHICYIICIFTVRVHGGCYVHFLNQFPLLLVNALKKNTPLKPPVLLFLETIQLQAENLSTHTKILDLYQLSLAKLLKNERFQE